MHLRSATPHSLGAHQAPSPAIREEARIIDFQTNRKLAESGRGRPRSQ
jgi:hypothetical protein